MAKPEGGEVTLLIDGDVVAFVAASAVQRVYEDEFGFVSPFANRKEGEAVVDNIIIGLEIAFKSTHRRVALSCIAADNFRKRIWADYKASRGEDFAGQYRPLLLGRLKAYLRQKYGAFHWDGLEADDVLGILATEPQEYPGERILVGRDKDFRTIPGKYHQLTRFDNRFAPIVEEITEWQAQRYHLLQTLMGDATDGYHGCQGLGKTRAERLLDNPVRLTPQPGVKTRGVNKGESTTKWVAEPTRDLWAMVVSHYEKAGQNAQDALTNARLAYILRHEDYNRETEEISLWTPDRLRQA